MYKLRPSVAGIPNVWFEFDLMEDDAGSRDRGSDDRIWIRDREHRLTELADTGARIGQAGYTLYEISSTDLFEIDVTIETNLSSCAIQWAGLVMAGYYVVEASDIHRYLECAN